MAGILDTIQLMGVLIFAIPAAMAGADYILFRDQPLIGVALIGMAIVVVAIKHFLSLPTSLSDVLSIGAEKTLGDDED